MTEEPRFGRRPDGTPYESNPFNVRQFEEEFGPGGVPAVYSQEVNYAGLKAVQNPNGIIVVSIFVLSMSVFMVVIGVVALRTEIDVAIFCFIAAPLGVAGAVWGFIMAGRRRRWIAGRKAAEAAQR